MSVQQGKAIVKNVLSGDTLVLMGQAKANGPPPEMQLSLASIRAPRLSPSGDEDFAWQSRQFLQKLCIGKPVRFKIEFSVEMAAGGVRKFGTIFCGPGGKVNACKAMVENGFATVKKVGGSSDRSEIYDDLVAAEEAAKSNAVGMYTTDEAEVAAGKQVIERKPDGATCEAIFEEVKDQVVEAVVDYVRDGSSLRVLLPAHNCVVSFNLAGVLCPMMRPRGSDKPAPYARQAKHFVETRLLGRRLNVRCGGFNSKNNVFYGKVEHPKGDISAELLKVGYGKTSWTLEYTPNADGLKQAELKAQAAQVGIFKGFKKAKSQGRPKFKGIVAEVVSGDTLVVTEDGTDAQRRVSLSSIQTPRLGRRNPRNESEQPEPYSFQAKEFLRSSSIGRNVTVSIEYSRTGNQIEGRPAPIPRDFATVLVGGKADQNLATMLVGRGFAKVVNHRADDPRSAHYAKLREKETAAEKGKKGMHSKGGGIFRQTDLCGDATKAKRSLNAFQRAGRRFNKAVVEYCFNAGKFKVRVPKENTVMFFALSGVRCPSTARPARGGYEARPAEPYAEEAMKLVKGALQQRDVQIEVDGVDERGTFMGSLFAKIDGKANTNLSLYLVEHGLGKLLKYSAERSPYATQLFALEKRAKQAKLRIWENFVERTQEEDTETEVVSAKTYSARVQHIQNGQEFYLSKGGDDLTKVEDGMEALTAKYGDKAVAAEGDDVVTPVKKDLVAALFDGVWYRASIDHVVKPEAEEGDAADATTLCEISFVDYGNKQAVEPTGLRPLPAELKAIAPQAFKCKLALVKVPGLEKQYGESAAQYLAELTWGKELTVQDTEKGDGVTSVVLTVNPAEGEAKEDAATVNELLVSEGLARYQKPFVPRFKGRGKPKKSPLDALTKKLKDAHAAAANAHKNMFAYGDFDSDDDPKRDAF